MAAWARYAHGHAKVVLMLSVLFTITTGVYLAGHIKINTDTADILSPELPFRQNDKAVNAAFPQLKRTILLVLDGPSPDEVDVAAERLTERLKAKPEIYGPLFDLAGEPFFQKNGILLQSGEKLETLAERLSEAQPFLATLWKDTSLSRFFTLLATALEAQAGGEAVPLPLARVLERIADVAEAQARGEAKRLSWQNLIAGEEAPGRRLMIIKPPLNFKTLSPGATAIRALRDLRAELGYDGEAGVRLRLSGDAALKHEELKSVERGIGFSGVLSVGLVTVLLMAAFASGKLVIATVATLLVGLVWTAGFAVLSLPALNLISVAFAVLFIGLSVDFGIHFALRYREALLKGLGQGDAIGAAAEGCGTALVLCAVAAAIAFYSFLPTDYLGLAELGLIAGTGMFVALFANLTVLPAVLGLLPLTPRAGSKAAEGHGPMARAADALNGVLARHPRAVLAGAAGVAAVSLWVAQDTRFDFDPLNLKDPKAESVSTILDLAMDPKTTPYVATVLAGSVDEAEETAKRLTDLEEVAGTVTLKRFLPEDVEDRAFVIGDLALFLGPALPEGGGRSHAAPGAEAEALDALLQQLASTAEGRGDLSVAAKRLEGALRALAPSGFDELEKRLLGLFPRQINALKTSLAAEPFAGGDLPEALVRRYVAEDGRARLLIFPKEDLRDVEALRRFVAAVRTVAPEASGSPFTIFEAGRAVLSAFYEAGAIAIVSIGLLLLLVLRSVTDAIFVFLPLTLAGLLTAAASVLFATPLNFANVIVLPLLFGLGVASGIHLVLRNREETAAKAAGGSAREAEEGDVFTTSTPRAVLFSALTTIGSFSSLALSDHAGTASMGLLLTVAVGLTLVCTLVVLPALLSVRGAWRRL